MRICASATDANINRKDLDTVCICAIRYCQGRISYLPSDVIDICRRHLEAFSDDTIDIMIRDCEFQEKNHIYGDEEIDKPMWQKWKTDLLKERNRRKREKQIKWNKTHEDS